ncbi:Uncharacterised protein [Orientia tsutsugamushi]|nr:Uncharacterised protein [Orientia tsutsugamushi]
MFALAIILPTSFSTFKIAATWLPSVLTIRAPVMPSFLANDSNFGSNCTFIKGDISPTFEGNFVVTGTISEVNGVNVAPVFLIC